MGIIIVFFGLMFGLVAGHRRGWDVQAFQAMHDLAEATDDERAAIRRFARDCFNNAGRFVSTVAVTILVGGIAAVVALGWNGHGIRFTPAIEWWHALICACVAVFGILLIYRHKPRDITGTPLAPPAAPPVRHRWLRRRLEAGEKSPFWVSIISVLSFGLICLFVSAHTGNQILASIAMLVDVILVPWMVFGLIWPVLWTLKSVIAFAEFAGDRLMSVFTALHEAFRHLRAERKPGINIANEEQILPALTMAVFGGIGMVGPTHVANVFLTGFVTIFVWGGLITLPIMICWFSLMAMGVNITGRRVRNVLLFLLLVLIAVLLSIAKVIVLVFFPDFPFKILGWVVGMWTAGITMLSPWEAGIGFGLGTLAFTLLLWLWKPVPPSVLMNDGTRQEGLPIALYAKRFAATFSFGVALFCGANLAFAGHYRGGADMVGADGVRLSMMHAPTVTAEDGGVRLAWEPAANAVGYRLSWRVPTEGTFHGVLGAKDLRKGVLEYLDTDIEPGSEYFYRVTAIYPDGWKSDPSPEVRVYVPKAEVKPRKAEPKPNPDPPTATKPVPVVAEIKPVAKKAKVRAKSPPASDDLALYCERWGC